MWSLRVACRQVSVRIRSWEGQAPSCWYDHPVIPSRRSTRLVAVYVLSLAATFGVLIVWIVSVVRSAARLQALGRRVGVAPEEFGWILLTVGCLLLFFLMVALTYQLAQALAASR